MNEPRSRPIIFSAEMVRAILAGRKTQTRRIIKPQPSAAAKDAGVIHSGTDSNGVWAWLDSTDLMEAAFTTDKDFRCPYGVLGDGLWVRETFCPIYPQDPDYNGARPIEIDYRATPTERMADRLGLRKWKPAIFMPRWASRIMLTVTDIRVERLQAISEADAIAEGCPAVPLHSLDCDSTPPSSVYRALWESIHGRGSWAVNPWVFAISFQRIAK